MVRVRSGKYRVGATHTRRVYLGAAEIEFIDDGLDVGRHEAETRELGAEPHVQVERSGPDDELQDVLVLPRHSADLGHALVEHRELRRFDAQRCGRDCTNR